MQIFVINLANAAVDMSLVPNTVDLSNIQSSVKNQGNRGACTFFSATSLLESEIIKQHNIEINISEQFMIFAVKNYDRYGVLEEGSSVVKNLQAAKKYGITYESDSPYQQSWLSPGMPCSQDSYSASSNYECYHHNSGVDADRIISLSDNIEIYDIDDYSTKRSDLITSYLAKNKRPVSVNIVINDEIMLNSVKGKIEYNKSLSNECNVVNQCFAHSIVITGYNLKDQTFKFKNSYGKNWGNNGYGTIAFEYINKLYGAPQITAVKLKEKVKLIKQIKSEDISPKASLTTDINFDGNDINIQIDGKVEYLPKSQFKIQVAIARLNDNSAPTIVKHNNKFINSFQYATTDNNGSLDLDEVKMISFKNVRKELTNLNEKLYLFTMINKVDDIEDINIEYTSSELTFPTYIERFKDCSEASKKGYNPDKQLCLDRFKGNYTFEECLNHATFFEVIYMSKVANCFKEFKEQSNFKQCSSIISSVPKSLDQVTQLDNCKSIYKGEYSSYECSRAASLIYNDYDRNQQKRICNL
ncbi:C1 family peptidase [Halobacteriovorax sp. ZH4_bin.1]|uniref:C1 family peptidase n=2 Tax=Halobacteriovorax TaxID=1652133 RepID=UPI003722091D